MKRIGVFKHYVTMVLKVIKLCPQYVVCSLLTSLITALLSITNIFFEKYLINQMVMYASYLKVVLILSLIVFVPFLVSLPNTIISNCLLPKYTQIITYEIQKELLQKAAAVPLGAFDDSSFYNNYTIAVQQAAQRAFGVIITLSSVLSACVSIFILIGVIATVDPVLILLALLSAITNLIGSTLTSKISLKYVDRCILDDRKAGYISRIFYLVDYAKEVRMYNGPNLFFPKYKETMKTIGEQFVARGKENTTIHLVSSFITSLLGFIMLALISYRAFILGLSIGGVVALINSSQYLKSNIFSITSSIQNMYEHSLYIKKYNSFLTTPEQNSTGNLAMLDVRELVINEVSFKYPNSVEAVLSNISMTIKRGEYIALIGENGSGKSTLAKILARLYEPTAGEILINGVNYLQFKIDAYRQGVFFLFQDYKCFSLSVAENVLMRPCLTKHDEDIVISALQYAGLLDRICQFPSGIHSMLTKEFDANGIVLSGGEIQKLSIARMYACQSKIIILDEPTSALDSNARKAFIKSLKRLPQNPIIILISHTIDDISDVDRVYALSHGEIVAVDSTDMFCDTYPTCI